MKKRIYIFFIGCFLTACYKDLPAPETPLLCTENYVMYTLEIPGEPLDDFFTYREATQDSIRMEREFHTASLYPVLDDRYKDSLVDVNERFLFVGTREENPFEVRFVFSSDRCHIVKISGPEFFNPNGE